MPVQHVSKQSDGGKRKPALSPELNEFLHMLKALENGSGSQPAGTR